jgi:serine/threonine-protein kinase
MAAAEVWDEASQVGVDEGRHRVGRYLLTHELAAGGMGTVYLGRADGPKGFGKLVAVKLMHESLADSELADMFADEARIGSLIHHPNVCQIYDFGEHEGVFFLVMELLAGVPLSTVLPQLSEMYESARRPAAYFTLVARIMAEVLAGLHAVHEATDEDGRPLEVVHRDISPDNLFVTWNGAVRIVDFGIAGGRGRIHRTQAGIFKGKLAYAAPERFRGKVARTADIWSAGAVFWEMLTLHCVFERGNDMQTLQAVTQAPIADACKVSPDVPPALAAIAHRALSRDPKQRYQTAREMARAINAWVATQHVIDANDVAAWIQSICPADYEASRKLFAEAREIGRPSTSLAWAATAIDQRTPPPRSEPPSISGVHTLLLDVPPSEVPPPIDPASLELPAYEATKVTPSSWPPARPESFVEEREESGVRPSDPMLAAATDPTVHRGTSRLALVVLALLAAAAVAAGAFAGLAL